LLSDFESLPFLSFVEDSDFRGNHHHHESPKASTLRPLTCIRNTLDAAMCLQALVESLDFIIDTASGNHPFDPYMFLLKTCGVLVLVGAPSEIKIKPRKPYWCNETLNVHYLWFTGMRSIFGSATGGMKDTQEMIDLCAEKEIYPNIEVIPIEYANEAFERIINKDVKYRYVIDIEIFLK
ncbi:hypothetical protein HN51_052225, partial [Arachis hypogaea]